MKKFPYPDIIERAGWMGGFTIVYFSLVRPLRALYSEKVIFEMLVSSQHSIGNITSAFHSARRVVVTYMNEGNEIGMTHIPQFGFFFLCGLMGLIFIKASQHAYLGLILFQLAVELFVLFLFWLGIHYTIIGFILSDFLITYLSPLGCLGLVVLASVRIQDTDYS